MPRGCSDPKSGAIRKAFRMARRFHIRGQRNVDLLRRRVTYQTNQLELTPKEYDLLTFLVSRPGEVLQREEILTEVWGSEHLDARSVDVHVRYLREKLGKQGAALIRTVWGKGYQLGGK